MSLKDIFGKKQPAIKEKKTSSGKDAPGESRGTSRPGRHENGDGLSAADGKTGQKGKDAAVAKTGASASRTDLKTLVDHVIDDEEKTIRNYINPFFWADKGRHIREIREKERQGLGVYELLSDGANPSREYYILTVLSCIVATTGLIQGSTAVIIGAMIIAPLMTPILAFSLGVIWGDLRLVRTASGSILKGMFWAVLISASISFIVPFPEYSSEIMARTRPSLFDIIVALASGIVGAYGNANEKISNTLVGIAIAVALMPPLCTVGIGIGTANVTVASGAMLLFAINLVSIGLAGAVVFWLMKVHPPLADGRQVARRALYQIVLSVIMLAAIAVPVSFFMYEDYRRVRARECVRLGFEREFPAMEILELEARQQEGKYALRIVLTGSDEPDRGKLIALKKRIIGEHPAIGDLKVIFMKGETILRD